MTKLHSLFVHYHSANAKTVKFEETFKQLDQIFSQDTLSQRSGGMLGNDEENKRVLEDLRRLNNNYLAQIFDL